MIKDYLIVNKKILPDYYSKVVEARILMESAQCKSVSDAVKKVGISRSTYYKYKDYIFTPSENYGRKFTLSFKLDDTPGILSNILTILRDHQTSIITIHQDIPINQAAVVIVTLDGKDLILTIDELMAMLEALDGVHGVQLIAME
ncbi:ACT domain-containing protein [Acetobacterium carbinolicum]|jgi:chorismate mutase|uniref:ACT domain-containing protein n=1 Tax=Acetobacterium TaxID=33951 RepID=UPI000DBEB278|nr:MULTISPECIES: ACT domain-containing protein [unclassified Acetobacterium]AWW27079.1 ACT domain-containing protein [Acetobacterium sp. KB-1]MDK2942998.1 chorismate mutase [Acetobacterium sp.]MDZ5724276.1 ACT domain-containing protein [Acetobacterium sp. K1/6]